MYHRITATILRSTLLVLVLFAGLLGITASGGGGGGGGGGETPTTGANPSVAAKTSAIPPGDADCPAGGTLVETGIDEDGNGVLDANEVDASEKVCNGGDSLVAMNPEPVGVNCPTGGLRIDSGVDGNGNDRLDANEITQTGYLCNPGDDRVGWQAATLLEGSVSNSSRNPSLDMNADGEAMAVWLYEDPAVQNYVVWASPYLPGTGWAPAQPIDSGTGRSVSASVAVDAKGNAMAIWQQHDGTRNNIWANRYDVATEQWAGPELVETADGAAISPQVKMDADGNAIAVWLQYDGTRNNIETSRYDVASGKWLPLEPVETLDADPEGIRLAVDDAGNALLVWLQSDGTRLRVRANHYLAGDTWQGAVILDAGDGDPLAASLALDTVRGSAMVAWLQSQSASERQIRYARFDAASGGWSMPAGAIVTGDASLGVPDLAMNADGDAMAIWLQTGSALWASRYGAGAGWGTPEPVERDSVGSAASPRVAMDAAGNVTVVWVKDVLSEYISLDFPKDIRANRHVPGMGWGGMQVISRHAPVLVRNPVLATDALGNALAVWEQSDGWSSVALGTPVVNNIWASRWQAP